MSGLPRFPCLLCISVCVLLGPTVTARAGASDARQPQSVRPTSEAVATLPFDLYQGYFIVARGSAGPLKNLNFFLDTGTSLPVLDSRIAGKLHLHGEEAANLIILGGQVKAEDAIVPLLELGPVQRTNSQVITADLSFFQRFLPIRIDAIVGLDMLGQSPFVIDYTARVIRFGVAPALPVSVPLRLDGGLAVFDAEIDQTPVHLLFDTGASSLVLFARETTEGSTEKVAEELAPKAIGMFKSESVRLRSLRLGTQEFRKEPALLTRNPQPSQLDFDGLMSPAALGISRVSVDLRAGVLAFSR